MNTIILASHNPNKAIEASKILKDYKVKSLQDIDFHQEIPETGDNLFANALLKVKAIYNANGCQCISDDTGLEVEALFGKPGVYSARYAGDTASDRENIEKLLSDLAGADNRRATFRTVLAYMNEQGQYRFFEGVIEGSIAEEPRGENGFGYDSIFIPAGQSKTFAEMSSAEKNKISHRKLAFQDFVKYSSLLKSA